MTRCRELFGLSAGCLLLFVAVCQVAIAADARRAQIADAIAAKMKEHTVPGVSLAVIDEGKIAWAEGFGRLSARRDDKVTPETLFQAASISKPVAAAGALSLVQEGRLPLDESVNQLLVSWKIPDADVTKNHPITLRQLLSHTGGLSVHGFPGYRTFAKRPTLVQILDGQKPANTQPIRAILKPGYAFRYSGGGYTVMQQLVIDTTDEPFAEFMQARVLSPLGMSNSTYEQPLPQTRRANAARAHAEKETVVLGGCHVYPEMAAAGLWTTPSDLATFAIDLSKSYGGTGGKLLSQETVRQMLTVEKGAYGLGLSVGGEGDALRFGHGGANQGFRCLMTCYPETGQGAVIMTNSNTGSAIFNDVVKLVGQLYDWPQDEP